MFYIALLLIASEYFIQPAWDALARAPESDFFGVINQLLIYWINAAAVSLAWALWEAQRYLGRLEAGAVWSVSTIQFIGRIGECLLMSALWATLLTPSINGWVSSSGGGFDWRLESTSVVLFGLGLPMAVIARVFGQVLETAAALKTDNDGIV